MVEATGFEPVTSCMPCKRSPGLSYAPTRAKNPAVLVRPGRPCPATDRSEPRQNTQSPRLCQGNIYASAKGMG